MKDELIVKIFSLYRSMKEWQLAVTKILNHILFIKSIRFTALCLFLFVIASCSKEETFEFEIKNTTGYRIDSMYFTGSIEKKYVSAEANSTTAKFNLKSTGGVGWFFAEPSLYYGISNYSDSLKKYKNSSGKGLAIDDLSDSNTILIEIDPTPHDPINIFKVSFN